MHLFSVQTFLKVSRDCEMVWSVISYLYRRNGDKRAVINGIVDEELSKMISRMGSGRHRGRLFQQRCTGPGIVGIPHL